MCLLQLLVLLVVDLQKVLVLGPPKHHRNQGHQDLLPDHPVPHPICPQHQNCLLLVRRQQGLQLHLLAEDLRNHLLLLKDQQRLVLHPVEDLLVLDLLVLDHLVPQELQQQHHKRVEV